MHARLGVTLIGASEGADSYRRSISLSRPHTNCLCRLVLLQVDQEFANGDGSFINSTAKNEGAPRVRGSLDLFGNRFVANAGATKPAP